MAILGAAVAWATTNLSSLWLKIAGVAGVVLAILVVALKLIAMGKTQERSAEQARVAAAAQAKKDKVNEIDRLSDGAVDQRLARWVRPYPGADK